MMKPEHQPAGWKQDFELRSSEYMLLFLLLPLNITTNLVSCV